MMRFDRKYFLIFVILLILEIFIAIYIHDSFVRPFVGDLLVVILIYNFVSSFWKANHIYMAIGVLTFAFCVEISQYYHIIDLLGIDNKILRLALGNSFDWMDLLAYTLGIGVVIGAEKYRE